MSGYQINELEDFDGVQVNWRTASPDPVKTANTDTVIKFLAGKEIDNDGRCLAHYLDFSPEDWEAKHDVIQWAFPNHVQSKFHPSSPVVEVGRVMKHPDIHQAQANMATLFFSYLSSLSIDLGEDEEFFLTKPNPYWLESGNHNHLRITRVIIALRLFKMDIIAEKFGKFVLQLPAKYPYAINNTTVGFWHKALHDKLN